MKRTRFLAPALAALLAASAFAQQQNEIIVESFSDGQNASAFEPVEGKWFESISKSKASGLTAAATGLSKGAPRTLGLLFIAGLLGGAAVASALIRRSEVQITSDIWLLVLGGLIVGFGTRHLLGGLA